MAAAGEGREVRAAISLRRGVDYRPSGKTVTAEAVREWLKTWGNPSDAALEILDATHLSESEVQELMREHAAAGNVLVLADFEDGMFGVIFPADSRVLFGAIGDLA